MEVKGTLKVNQLLDNFFAFCRLETIKTRSISLVTQTQNTEVMTARQMLVGYMNQIENLKPS